MSELQVMKKKMPSTDLEKGQREKVMGSLHEPMADMQRPRSTTLVFR